MGKLPFLSVVIPTLNERKYIENTLRSIKSQDYAGKYEIIVSDSMSRDDTVKIARKYADKVVETSERGISVGRNRGAKAACGEIIIFVDADTILLPNALGKLAAAFRKKEIVGATCTILPFSSKMLDQTISMMYNEFVKDSIKIGKPKVSGVCFAVRSNAFKWIGGFNKEMASLEDFDLAGRLGKIGKIAFVDGAIVVTSYRRIEKWGRLNSIKKYGTKFIKYIVTGKAFDFNEYKPVR